MSRIFIFCLVWDGVCDKIEVYPNRQAMHAGIKKLTGYTFKQINDAEPETEPSHYQGSDFAIRETAT